jgi:hypothetical protein
LMNIINKFYIKLKIKKMKKIQDIMDA